VFIFKEAPERYFPDRPVAASYQRLGQQMLM